jgi:hypothetical protein
VRHSALCDGSDNQLSSLIGDVEQRKRGQYLAVDCSLVRTVLCALLGLFEFLFLPRRYPLALSLDRRIPFTLCLCYCCAGCKFCRFGLSYAPRLSIP